MSKIDRSVDKVLAVMHFIAKWILVSIIFTIIVILFYNQYITYARNKVNYTKPFNSIEWKKRLDVERDHNNRPINSFEGCYMYQDLIKNYIHIGMTQDEIIEIIGEPQKYKYYTTNSNIKTFTYIIGNCVPPAFIYKDNNLILYFDRNLKLIDFEDDVFFTYLLWRSQYNKLKNKNLRQIGFRLAYYNSNWRCWKEDENSPKKIANGKIEEECGIKLW